MNNKEPGMKTTTHDPESQLIDLNSSLVCRTALERALHEGAQKMLQAAIEVEVSHYIEQHLEHRDAQGHRLVRRNGSKPARTLQSPLGSIRIQQPRVHDRRPGHRFTSNLLPPYLRRVASLDNLIPALYLRGISTNEMQPALEAILGPKAAGLSPANIARLKSVWEDSYQQWQQRDLTGKHYVYVWVDGIYFNVRLSDERPCVLVMVGALADGTKELVGLYDGQRESKLSWKELLSDLKGRGLTLAPALAVGDGALGFWAALEEEFPGTQQQRCWVHKTANVLDKMAKSVQPAAKDRLHQIYLAPTRKEALKAWKQFIQLYEAKYPKACACLQRDQEVLLRFYDYPAEHWSHLRTTNPIESTFASVRHRTRQTKGCGSRKATLAMVFQLLRQAESRWRRLNGSKQLDKVIAGVVFTDGEEQLVQQAA
jgi:transposase-like protein